LAEGTRDILAAELRRRGADVTSVPAYRTVRVLPGDAGEPDLHKMLLDQQVDAVTFGNPSTVREFVELYGAEVVADLLKTTVVRRPRHGAGTARLRHRSPGGVD
jgi:uroporphyrinogen-III synthase